VFWLFSAAVVVAMVVGVVALNAMLAQAAFAMHAARADLTELTERHEVLVKQLATASAPNRVAEWATSQGMEMPGRVEILTVPGLAKLDRG
jgi:cell division protein FtsL